MKTKPSESVPLAKVPSSANAFTFRTACAPPPPTPLPSTPHPLQACKTHSVSPPTEPWKGAPRAHPSEGMDG